MVHGKIVAVLNDGTQKEMDIQPCDLFVGLGIEEVVKTRENVCMAVQSATIGGLGMNKSTVLDTIASGIINIIAGMDEDPAHAAAMVLTFAALVKEKAPEKASKLSVECSG